jgi:hypothetical protein
LISRHIGPPQNSPTAVVCSAPTRCGQSR